MKKIMISNKTLSRIVYIIVLLFFVVPVIFTFAKFIAFSLAEPSEHNELMKSEYLLMTIQSLLGIFSINIPYLLTKKYKIRIPITFIILYDVFLFCAIYLGEIRKFYIKVNMWDNVLHAFSSLILIVNAISISADFLRLATQKSYPQDNQLRLHREELIYIIVPSTYKRTALPILHFAFCIFSPYFPN